VTIATFIRDMGPPENVKAHRDLAKFWAKTWSQAGFTPRVIYPTSANTPRISLKGLRAAFDASPTVNDRTYEWACYERWAYLAEAAALIQGPILCVDDDFVPNPRARGHRFFKAPKEFWDAVSPLPTVLDINGNPSGMLADAAQLRRWVTELQQNIPTTRTEMAGRLHVSDQTIARKVLRSRIDFTEELGAPDVGSPRGVVRPLIHVSTDGVIKSGHKGRKVDWIEANIGTYKAPAK